MASKYLKRALINGKDVDMKKGGLADYCFYTDDCIVIGTKVNGFTYRDLSKLEGRINKDTRIDVNAHGSVYNGQLSIMAGKKHYSTSYFLNT
jgi:hypothetical protein